MNYAKIKKHDIANGEGVRVSLFVSGCKFNCSGCFNKEAQNYDYGEKFTIDTVKYIMQLVSDDNVDGLSILGGDPLCQDHEGLRLLYILVHKMNLIGKSVWLWSGYTWEELHDTKKNSVEDYMKRAIVYRCNVFVDGRFEEDKRDLRLKWRGSSNQRVIDVSKTLKESKIVLYEE